MGRPSSSRAVILAAGRSLLAERGYRAVTIRQIATEAGLSPAMVRKVVGSKAKLFAAATLLETVAPFGRYPRERLGRELVRRVFARRGVGAAESWSQALHLIQDAPVRRRPVQISADTPRPRQGATR